MKLIEKLKYIRKPCKKCLVQPICKNTCNKLEKHYEIYHFIGDHDSIIILSIEIFLIILGLIIFLSVWIPMWRN